MRNIRSAIAHSLIIFFIPAAALNGIARVIGEDFAADPAARNWQAYGDSSLFHWNGNNQNLEVTWDSSRPNSYFHLPLGLVLTTNDDFGFSCDLRFQDVAVGVNPQRPFSFQVAIGFLGWENATNSNLQRGSGVDPDHGPRNCFELDYFPDSGFGATISPTLISSNNEFASGFDFPLEMDPGALFHIAINFTSATRTLHTVMTRNGQPFGPIHDVVLSSSFTDFRLDQFAIMSYSDTGADGSLLAHGTIDNAIITLPDTSVTIMSGQFVSGHWRVLFNSRPDSSYSLQRTTNFLNWTIISSPAPGTGSAMTLDDTNPPADKAFYRVKTARP